MRKSLLMLLGLTLPVAAQPASRYYDRLWVQTSADYRAHCYQTYGWAERTLQEQAQLNPLRDSQGRVVQRTLVRDTNGQMQWVERPLAVVMDLDETVIDMSAYRVYLTKTGSDYTPDSWNAFLQYLADHPQACRAVPGALDFIQAAQQLGFTVVFISNRTQPFLQATVRTLEHLGVRSGPRLLSPHLDATREEDHAASRDLLTRLGESETSDEGKRLLKGEGRKERRRLEAFLSYQPVEFVGDDLGDFFAFVKDPQWSAEQKMAARAAAVDSHRAEWGRRFFYIPNPMYGNWSPGATLPLEHPESVLHDDGFTEWYQGTRRPAP